MKKLLFSLTKKNFVIETMKGCGPGGQHKNTTDSAVRITHPESGASAYSQSERSQLINKKMAFKALINSIKFRNWIKLKIDEIDKKQTLEEQVDEMMKEENIKTEYKIDGKWKEIENAG